MMEIQALIDPEPVESPIVIEPPRWYVMLTEPQQDLTTVWRMHELGLELFVPLLRKRIKTGRIGKNGHKLTRIVAKPMFPGYGFLRTIGVSDYDKIKDVRGVRDFMLDIGGNPVTLPHEAVMAVFQKQMQEHYEWLQTVGARRGAKWKKGDLVRVDSEGGVYAGLVATIDKIDRNGRIQILLGMIRHTLPADMVVAA